MTPEAEVKFGPIVMRSPGELTLYNFRSIPLPEPEGEDDERIRQSIGEHRVLDPLMVLADGRVFNGRARLRHAQALGLKTVPTRELLTPLSPVEVEVYATRLKLARRHITGIQLFNVLHSLSGLVQERVEAAKRPRGRPRIGGLTAVSAKTSKNQKTKRTDKLVAQVIGTSSDTVFRLQAIKRRGSPELFNKVLAGELAPAAAYRALAPALAARDPNRMPVDLLETLDVEIPKQLWELVRGFQKWPRADQDTFLEAIAQFREDLRTALDRRRADGA